MNFDDVLQIGLSLPGVEESTGWGQPALRIHGKLIAVVARHSSAEPNSLVVSVDSEDRAELLAADPEVYYITNHYIAHDTVLVRLSRVAPDVLHDLLSMACRFVSRKGQAKARKPKR